MRPPEILIVDDDATTRSLLESILTRAGFLTRAVVDTATATAAVRSQQPDLVLLDVNLPDGTGFELARWLTGPAGLGETPVIFISSDGKLFSKLRGFEAGGVDYVTKPLAAPEVLARVSTHLRLRQAYQNLAALQAERLQRLAGAQAMLMPTPGELPAARFEVARRQVLQAGGDFYDVIPCGHDMVDYVVADASGHDLAATYWTASLKTLLAEYATPARSPREILQAVNGVLRRVLPGGAFFTLVYARLNRQARRLYLANAAHPPVIALRGQEALVLEQEGDVLGAFADAVFATHEVAVSAGDRLFLYTDGLIDGRPQRQGVDELAAACAARRTTPLAAAVPELARELTRGGPHEDDVLLLGVEV